MTLAQLRADLRPAARDLLLPWGLAAVVLAAVLVVHLRTGLPVSSLTRDPLAIAALPPWVGAVSNLGIVLWAIAAGLAIGAARVTVDAGWRRFHVTSAAFTLVLLVDDLFQFHETLLPRHLGIPERRVYLAYGVLTAAYLARHGRRLLETAPLLAAAAFGGLGLSAACDALTRTDHFLTEDGIKLLGIAGWVACMGRMSAAAVGREVRGVKEVGGARTAGTAETAKTAA